MKKTKRKKKKWESKETPSQRKRRLEWRREMGKTHEVKTWIIFNPPPDIWESDKLDWAYTEMPAKWVTKLFGEPGEHSKMYPKTKSNKKYGKLHNTIRKLFFGS